MPAPDTRRLHLATILAIGIVVALTGVAYSNSLRVPFLFDDIPSIERNSSIRGWAEWTHWWIPPPATTVSGRPLLNASFALDYCLSGYAVWSYHLTNLLIHLVCGLFLFLIARDSLPEKRRDGTASATVVAAAAAGLWLLHPLQTESVTYLVQRAESLATLFYLAALFFFIRSTRGSATGGAVSIGMILCGTLTKEIVVTAPVVILLYDYAFVSGSLGKALRCRWRYYLGAALSWPLAIALLIASGGRNSTVAFGTEVHPWSYLLTQAYALCRYAYLSILPVGQIFFYGGSLVTRWAVVIPCGLAVLAALTATGICLVRRPRLGFLLAGVFLVLSPTSSFIPIVTETIAEHRMYLPLAFIVAGIACLLGQLPARWFYPVVAGILAAFCGATYARNADYASALSIWRDASEKQPEAYDIANNFGAELARVGRTTEAKSVFEQSITRHAYNPPGLVDLANLLRAEGREEEADRDYALAMRQKPDFAPGLVAVGFAYCDKGRLDEAEGSFRKALEIEPDMAEAFTGLGTVLFLKRQPEAAIRAFDKAISLDPDDAQPLCGLANLALVQGNLDSAKSLYDRSLSLKPDYPEALAGRAQLEGGLGDTRSAEADYRSALSLRPSYAEADYGLGNLYLSEGKTEEALQAFQGAVAARPAFAEAELNLAAVLLSTGRVRESLPHFARAVALQPGSRDAHHNFALALHAVGDDEAAAREAALAGER